MTSLTQSLLLACLLAGSVLSGQAGTPLLGDSSLTGWRILLADTGEVAVADQALFVWEDSVLHVLGAAVAGSEQPFAALVTNRSYSSYRLHVEYRWGEKKFAPRTDAPRDAGVLFHVADSSVFWPTSLEYQIQEGDTGDIWLIGSLATSFRSADGKQFLPEGTEMQRRGDRYVRFTHGGDHERPGWNSVELVVRGDQAEFYLNGHLVNALVAAAVPDGAGGWVPLTAGPVALQAEGAEIYYRNVVITALP